jgi:predicted Zn-dependent protease
MLASTYMDAGRHAQAVPLLEDLIQRDPQDPEPHVQLAICCIILGKLQKAASLVKFLKRNQPDNIEIVFLQGMIDFKGGKSRQALRHFQSVVSQEPGHALAHYFIGEIYFKGEAWRRALQAYQMSARANPKDADAQASQCLCYLALGKKREARSALREALSIDPDNTLAQRIQHELKF